MIVAIDFDGVLVENRFPDIGDEVPCMVELARDLMRRGHEVILWTSRVDERLTEAVRWCEARGIEFSAVNENAPSNRAAFESQYPNGTRKVYADVYLDDHSVEWAWYSRQFGEEWTRRTMARMVYSIIDYDEFGPEPDEEEEEEEHAV